MKFSVLLLFAIVQCAWIDIGAGLPTTERRLSNDDSSSNDWDKISSFADAIEKQKFEDVQKLISDGGITNSMLNNALLRTSSLGNERIADLLIKSGADVNAKNGQEVTALDQAVIGGHEKIAELLIKNGADVNLGDYLNQTALYHAIKHSKGDDKKKMFDFLIAHGSNINDKAKYDHTMLHASAITGVDEIAEFLIKSGADVNARNTYHSTPLHDAAMEGHLSTVKLLIENGADIKAKGFEGETALQKAIAYDGDKQLAKYLIKQGSDINTTDDDGNTLLHTSAIKDKVDIAEMLIKKFGLKVNAQNNEDNTPLHIAAVRGHEEMVKLLLENGADRNIRNKYSRTALSTAEEHRYLGAENRK